MWPQAPSQTGCKSAKYLQADLAAVIQKFNVIQNTKHFYGRLIV